MTEPQIALMLIAITVMAVGAVGWWRAVWRLMSGRPILPYEPRRHVPWGLLDLVLMLVLYVGAVMVCAMLAKRMGVDLAAGVTKENAGQMLLLQLAIQVLSTIPGLALIALRTRASAFDLGFDWRVIRRDVATGAIAFAMLAPPVFAIQAVLTELVPYQHDIIDIIREDPNVLLLAGVSAVLAAPITEELQFRVLLQGWLEKLAVWRGDSLSLLVGGRGATIQGAKSAEAKDDQHAPVDRSPEAEPAVEGKHIASEQDPDRLLNPYVSPRAVREQPEDAAAESPSPPDMLTSPPRLLDRWPILVSSLLFAGMHLGQGAAPIPLFVLALGLGYLYERTHRVLPSITVHLLLNGTTIVILAVEVLFPEAAGQ